MDGWERVDHLTDERRGGSVNMYSELRRPTRSSKRLVLSR